MQFDHIDPTNKLHNICQLKSCKVERLLDELTKCQVLCALCHREKSIKEQLDNKYSNLRIKPIKRKKLFYDLNANEKECGLCHIIKNGNEFRKRKFGLNTYCKKCFNEYRRNNRHNKKVSNNKNKA